MLYAIIKNGIVVNHAEAETTFAEAQGWVLAVNSKVGDSYANGVFTSPSVDIPLLKVQKNDEINSARLKANFTSFTHAGKAVACDELSRSDIDGTNGYVSLNGAMPPGWPGGWKAVDNTYIPIATVADWKAFYLSLFAAGNANFAKAQSLKATLASATTAAQISAIVW